MKPPSKGAVKSAARALDIIEYVGAQASPASFTRMLEDLGIPRSSLFHLLNNLLVRGYLQRDETTDRYTLGYRLRELATRVTPLPLAAVVASAIADLGRAFDETCGFYVRDGDSAVVIASATSSKSLSFTMSVGERAPLYAVSAGKMLLAQLTPRAFDAYLLSVKFDVITTVTITSKRQLREEIARARADQFALSREEFTPGITGMAVAVGSGDHVYGALNLAVPTARFPKDYASRFKRTLLAVARTLEAKLLAEGALPGK